MWLTWNIMLIFWMQSLDKKKKICEMYLIQMRNKQMKNWQ